MRELVSLKYYLDDNAQKMLDRMAKEFPAELRRAIAGVGFHMRQRVQETMRAGGPPGKKWEKTSNVQRYQRLEWIKKAQTWHSAHYYKKLGLKKISKAQRAAAIAGGHYLPNATHRWRSFGAKKSLSRGVRAMGRMIGGIRYKMEHNEIGVLVGGLNPSMDRYLRATQVGGVVGAGKYPSKIGTQPITPTMRRLFFAAGIPLKKGTRTITMHPRPLIRPVFEAHAQHVVNYLQLAVKNYAEGGNMSRDDMARQAGFRSSWL